MADPVLTQSSSDLNGKTLLTWEGYRGIHLLEQHTASSSASLDFTTCITSTYDDYLLEITEILPGTTATELYIQFSTDGGSNYSTSGYHWAANYMFTDSTTVAPSRSDSASGLSVFGTNPKMNTGTGRAGYASLYLKGLGSSSLYKVAHGTTIAAASNGVFGGGAFFGHWSTQTAVNALRLISSSGDLASGVARVYGIAK
jgi:hypothetical protein